MYFHSQETITNRSGGILYGCFPANNILAEWLHTTEVACKTAQGYDVR
jgi:hypothetical protein